MIGLNNVCKIYNGPAGDKKALAHIDLVIDKGEFVAIMGPSGSGKSTLLHIIGCMDVITSGSYMLENQELSNIKLNKLSKIRKKYISFVFQNFALMSHFTAYENIELPLLAKNIPYKKRKQIICENLKMLGIEEVKYKIPGQMSGGQQQRVATARALAADTDIILADEPTGSLDSETGMEIMEILRKINQEGKTVIIVTHDKMVAKYANRIIRIVDGHIVS